MSQDTVHKAQQQMQATAKRLEAMSERLAEARQIKEYDGDRRKRALASVMVEYLMQGESAAAAECKARASRIYGEELVGLGLQYKAALATIEEAEALRILFESSRSLLAVERAKIGLL